LGGSLSFLSLLSLLLLFFSEALPFSFRGSGLLSR